MYASANEHLADLESANFQYGMALSGYLEARTAYFETARLIRQTRDPKKIIRLNKKAGVLLEEKQTRLIEMKVSWNGLKRQMRVCNQNKAF